VGATLALTCSPICSTRELDSLADPSFDGGAVLAYLRTLVSPPGGASSGPMSGAGSSTSGMVSLAVPVAPSGASKSLLDPRGALERKGDFCHSPSSTSEVPLVTTSSGGTHWPEPVWPHLRPQGPEPLPLPLPNPARLHAGSTNLSAPMPPPVTDTVPLPLPMEAALPMALAPGRIHVGIAGEAGSGKSSLINAIVGSHVADVDVTMTDIDGALAASSFDMPGTAVTLWDMPGWGTPAHPLKTYVDSVGLDRLGGSLSSIVFVYAGRPSEGVGAVTKACRERGIPFVIVRNKADLDVKWLQRRGLDVPAAVADMRVRMAQDVLEYDGVAPAGPAPLETSGGCAAAAAAAGHVHWTGPPADSASRLESGARPGPSHGSVVPSTAFLVR
jgi:hypothetical protein